MYYLCNSYSGGSRISRRGGVDLVGGAVDPRGGYVSKIFHVKTKESGPVGGGGARRARPRLDPPMSYVMAGGVRKSVQKVGNCKLESPNFTPLPPGKSTLSNFGTQWKLTKAQ